MRKILILVLPAVLFVTGCAHQISEKSLALADRTVSFSKLRENPDAYRGKLVILGGTVADVAYLQEGTQLEVIQFEVDDRETPDTTSVSGGRFLAVTPDKVQIPACRPGALVSLAGEVAGRKVQPLKGQEYSYPVIIIKELHIIKSPDGNSLSPWNPYGA
jgi:outer membrane lipoprotein